MLNIQAAIEELDKKSYTDIQSETAWKWGSRAAASYQHVLSVGSVNGALVFARAEDYFGEAKEHAAQVSPEFLKEIVDAINPYYLDALTKIVKGF